MKLILLALLLLALPCSQAMTSEEFAAFQTWLSSDQTDSNLYVNVSYDCLAFSSAMAANATQAGQKDVYMANIQASQYPEGHWINAVLVDGDYVFIEPQADVLVELEGASITILDDAMQGKQELTGKNQITITGNLLLPIKT
jgi:archaellum component FlaF (FlaF/FlaG flagellin family)